MASSDILPVVEATSIVLFQSTTRVAINDIYRDYYEQHLLELLRTRLQSDEHFDLPIYMKVLLPLMDRYAELYNGG